MATSGRGGAALLRRYWWVALLVVAAVAIVLALLPHEEEPVEASVRQAAPQNGTADPRPDSVTLPADPAAWPPGTRVIPYEADDARAVEINRTLDLIEAGGPFPYEKDGTTFYNREGRLPAGDYLEYTVPTPAAANRGARRLVVAVSSGVAWYTDDHYETFRVVARVRWPA